MTNDPGNVCYSCNTVTSTKKWRKRQGTGGRNLVGLCSIGMCYDFIDWEFSVASMGNRRPATFKISNNSLCSLASKIHEDYHSFHNSWTVLAQAVIWKLKFGRLMQRIAHPCFMATTKVNPTALEIWIREHWLASRTPYLTSL